MLLLVNLFQLEQELNYIDILLEKEFMEDDASEFLEDKLLEDGEDTVIDNQEEAITPIEEFESLDDEECTPEIEEIDEESEE